MSQVIRDFRRDDAAALAHLFRASVEQLGPTGYDQPQVDAWAARSPGPGWFVDRANDGAQIWVAVTLSDQPAAYVLLETDGHLDHLYCHPDYARRGLAAQLLAVAEHNARTLGIARLYTEASEVARPVFERAGYRMMSRRDFLIADTPIHNYAMEKLLDAPADTIR